MKKLLSLVLALMMILGALPLMVSLAAGTPEIKVAEVSAKAGDTVDVPVSFLNNPGISTYKLTVYYDTSRLNCTGATSDVEAMNFSYNSDTQAVMWFNSKDVTTSGTFLTLHFNVLSTAANGKANVSLSLTKKDNDKFNNNISNYNEKDVDFSFTAGGVTVGNPVTLSSISVKTMPTKTTYNIGESFNQSGLSLTAKYSDNSTQTIINGFTCSGFSSTTAGTKTITVSYTEGSVTKTTTFTVTVMGSYTLTYNSNGGSGAPASQTGNGSITISSTKPTRTGYTFKNWNTKADGKGTSCNSGATFNLTANTTLYAQWTPNTYEVKFNGNGSTSGSMSNQSFTYDVAQNLTANAFQRKYTVTYNYNGATGGNSTSTATATATFNGWATSAGGSKVYNDKASVKNLATSGTYNLYANWTLGSVTLPTPTKTDSTFGGWYTDSSLTTSAGAAGASYKPGKNITLYAKWTTPVPDVTWNFDKSTGTLTISGTGDIKDYVSEKDTPWYSDKIRIKKIIINDGVTGIGNYAFASCFSVTSVTIPNSVTRIGANAFRSCDITSVTIPNNVTEICEHAFWNCEELATLKIGNGVKNIGEYAFSYCKSLVSITIPNGVVSIGKWAFSDCENLIYVHIPASVTSIGKWAFDDCKNFKYICSDTDNCYAKTYAKENNITFRNCSNVILSEESVKINFKKTYKLVASEDVAWSSSDTKVAKVDSNGNVTATGKGKATITAKSVATGKTATCQVTVKYSFGQILILIFLFGWIWYK